MERTPCEACEGQVWTTLFEKAGHPFVRCAGCGLERIDPQPDDDTLARIYGEHYYDAWDLKDGRQLVREMKKATFRRTLSGVGALRPGARILDCGAATGFLMEVAEEAGFDPFGIELSAFGAGEIAKRFGADHVFQGQVEDAHFPGLGEGAFDAIFMCDFLEHVRHPRRVLEKARRLLAPGGTVAICAPNLGSWSHRLMRAGWTHYKLEHLYYFNSEALRRLLARAGFTDYREALPWKTMSFRYVRDQFLAFPNAVVGSALQAMARVLPESIQRARFPVLMGEMLAYARRG
ncbi:MAG: class I SAM-dependent methyltransferase [Myxococcales bacterium]|nr:class I SAM-dependent methyltransferase [Myxococcales bacterium]